MVQSVQLKDANGAVLKIDRLVGAIPVIDVVHSMIHRGQFFSASVVEELNDSASHSVFIHVPEGISMHLRLSMHVGGDAEVSLEEGVVIAAEGDGTPIVPTNRNRHSDNSAEVLLFDSPTVDTAGTEIFKAFVPGGQSRGAWSAPGGTGGTFEEYILAPGNHVLSVTNESGGADTFELALDWYEDGEVVEEE
jgi:hypothetical protein